jgi:hypothetical protein
MVVEAALIAVITGRELVDMPRFSRAADVRNNFK